VTTPAPETGADLDFGAELNLKLGRAISDLGDDVRALTSAVRIPDVIETVAYGSGLGTAPFIDLGGPAQGRQWTIRRLGLSDPTGPGAAVAGLAFWFAAPVGTPGAPEWLWSMLSLPKMDTFSGEQVTVRGPHHLLVQLSGGSAVPLLAQAVILDHPADRFLRSV